MNVKYQTTDLGSSQNTKKDKWKKNKKNQTQYLGTSDPKAEEIKF